MKILTDINGKPYINESRKALKNTDPALITKTITENGNYSAVDDGVDGYSSVNVQTENRLNQFFNRTLTEITEDDLSGVTRFDNTNGVNKTIQKINFANTITSIGPYACDGWSALRELNVPISVKTVGQRAFRNTSHLSIYYQGTLFDWLKIDNNQDDGMSGDLYINNEPLINVIIPDGITTVQGAAFRGNKLIKSILCSDDVLEIGSNLRDCDNLESINFGNNLQSIGDGFGRSCTKLKTLDIPATIQSIGSYFYYSTSLQIMIVRAITPPILGSAFDTDYDTLIIVPYNSVNSYKIATNWSAQSAKMRGFGIFENGEALPTQTTDTLYSLTWYASIEDVRAETNPITVGNGEEVYCTFA